MDLLSLPPHERAAAGLEERAHLPTLGGGVHDAVILFAERHAALARELFEVRGLVRLEYRFGFGGKGGGK